MNDAPRSDYACSVKGRQFTYRHPTHPGYQTLRGSPGSIEVHPPPQTLALLLLGFRHLPPAPRACTEKGMPLGTGRTAPGVRGGNCWVAWCYCEAVDVDKADSGMACTVGSWHWFVEDTGDFVETVAICCQFVQGGSEDMENRKGRGDMGHGKGVACMVGSSHLNVEDTGLVDTFAVQPRFVQVGSEDTEDSVGRVGMVQTEDNVSHNCSTGGTKGICCLPEICRSWVLLFVYFFFCGPRRQDLPPSSGPVSSPAYLSDLRYCSEYPKSLMMCGLEELRWS